MERLFNSLVASAAVLAGFIVYQEWQQDKRVPIERWISTEAINSPVAGGDVLRVHIERVKVRNDCPVASSRQAISVNGRAYSLPSSVSIGGDAEAGGVDFDYPIPNDIPAGQYILRVFLTYTCPEFVWTTQQPDTPFQVIE